MGNQVKKVEYMSVNLSPTWSINAQRKQNELIDRLNELGSEGWILVSGISELQYATFMRIIYQQEEEV